MDEEKIISITYLFWLICTNSDDKSAWIERVCSWSNYSIMYLAIAKLLIPNFQKNDYIEILEQDWKNDSNEDNYNHVSCHP